MIHKHTHINTSLPAMVDYQDPVMKWKWFLIYERNC